MASGEDGPEDGPRTEQVTITLDAGLLRAVDAFRDRFKLADRSEAVSELLLVGLDLSMPIGNGPDH